MISIPKNEKTVLTFKKEDGSIFIVTHDTFRQLYTLYQKENDSFKKLKTSKKYGFAETDTERVENEV